MFMFGVTLHVELRSEKSSTLVSLFDWAQLERNDFDFLGYLVADKYTIDGTFG